MEGGEWYAALQGRGLLDGRLLKEPREHFCESWGQVWKVAKLYMF